LSTEYGKIETLFERDMVKGSPTEHRLLEPLRFKNPVYGQLAKMEWTEKVDGTNIRVDWIPEGLYPDPPVTDVIKYSGKTDRAVLPGNLVKWLHKNLNADTMRKRFESATVTLYGEGYGTGIQKGGGYRPDQAFILFDVFVHDVKSLPTFYTPSSGNDHWMQGYWMPDDMMREAAALLGIEVVPRPFGEMTIMGAAETVRQGFPSMVAGWHNSSVGAEGLVGRPKYAMYDSRGNRIIAKLKTKDFAQRKGGALTNGLH
jgi:hypothetical protein